jgi:hypothetical protein
MHFTRYDSIAKWIEYFYIPLYSTNKKNDMTHRAGGAQALSDV